jgi:hypothetical protein
MCYQQNPIYKFIQSNPSKPLESFRLIKGRRFYWRCSFGLFLHPFEDNKRRVAPQRQEG